MELITLNLCVFGDFTIERLTTHILKFNPVNQKHATLRHHSSFLRKKWNQHFEINFKVFDISIRRNQVVRKSVSKENSEHFLSIKFTSSHIAIYWPFQIYSWVHSSREFFDKFQFRFVGNIIPLNQIWFWWKLKLWYFRIFFPTSSPLSSQK